MDLSIASSSVRLKSRPREITTRMAFVLAMSAVGSASRRTRSASLPGATEPSDASRPRYFAGPIVAARSSATIRREPGRHEQAQFVVEAEPREDVRVRLIRPGQDRHAGPVQPADEDEGPLERLALGGEVLGLHRPEAEVELGVPERPGDRVDVPDPRVVGELRVLQRAQGAREDAEGRRRRVPFALSLAKKAAVRSSLWEASTAASIGANFGRAAAQSPLASSRAFLRAASDSAASVEHARRRPTEVLHALHPPGPTPRPPGRQRYVAGANGSPGPCTPSAMAPEQFGPGAGVDLHEVGGRLRLVDGFASVVRVLGVPGSPARLAWARR